MTPSWTLRRPFIIFLVILNLSFLAVIIRLVPRAVQGGVKKTPSALTVIAEPGPFELIRENGQAFSSAELKGHPWIAAFIFTRCAGACPIMSGRLAALQKDLPTEARIVSVSVDPAYDSPQRLKEYAERFQADPQKWIFLTGDPAVIARLQNDLKLSAADEPTMHSLRFVLVDAEGRVRAYHDSQDAATPKKILADLKKLGGK